MFFNEFQELGDLMDLGVAIQRLKIKLIRYPGMNIDVVAPADSAKFESEVFDDLHEVREPNVRAMAFKQSTKQLLRLHLFIPATSSIRFFGRFFSMRTAQTLYSGIREPSS